MSFYVGIVLIVLVRELNALQCVDHDKNPVDWFVVYKLPQEQHSNPLISQGVAYTYISSNDLSNWKLSGISINNTNSIVGLTLEPLFALKTQNFYVLYNDENPDGSVNFHKGHTKGLVLGNTNGGIWLVHSVPRFPPVDSQNYYYPHNGLPYGQSFLCISLNIQNLDNVGTQLLYNLPNIYFRNMPDNLKWMFPKLTGIINNDVIKNPPWYNLQSIQSIGGLKFMSFAKGPKFVKELYLDWVAPTLGIDLFVETWPNGPGRIPSECDIRYKVNNIQTVSISAANLTFKATTDHSKWAVASTDDQGSTWVCVGDINRATAQRQRGGGTVCFSVKEVASAYQGSIAAVEPCPN